MNNHKFRFCVEVARKHILGKDDFSLEARSLLAHLIYNHTNIEGINFQILNWETIKVTHSDLVEHYNMTENRFIDIKKFLIDNITLNMDQ